MKAIKNIFKDLWKGLTWIVNLIGMITIYALFMAAMFGKGTIDYHLPFSGEAKTIQWNNTNGNK